MSFRELCLDVPVEVFDKIDLIFTEQEKKKDIVEFQRRKERAQNKANHRNRRKAPVVVNLHKSEKAWKRPRDEDEKQKLYRDVTIALNKITRDNFDKVCSEILNMKIDDDIILAGVIDIIFAKAIDEPNFGAIYAQLCHKLSIDLKIETIYDEEALKAINSGRTTIFRRILLNKCQQEYSKKQQWKLEADKVVVAEDDEEVERLKIKRRALGNIIFIGELFKLNLLTEKIIHFCINDLLKNPEEEEIESLCKLLITVGSKLDSSQSRKYVDEYFQRIKNIIEIPELNNRLRFSLMDVVDLRKNNWQSKKKVKSE
ncbi:ARM repeat-containing protein, partial [Rozella allomycis CSF55]